ncbi:hypothetical protein Pmani_014881 [Petrolisthes manimaculis]|uniref:Kazal-like domain-containing protein n=1 Tax=Petrolisthes manimaculis TaxID=1843537 RepID=A0AAE1PTD4_9EUCA|nr:hypothetical protein Pmani_014881 [Petrolisthes manimaculis]
MSPGQQQCVDDCGVMDLWDPQCASDGNTYSNSAMIQCVNDCTGWGLWVLHPGECEGTPEECLQSCSWPEYYQPVCGTDGNTYGNPEHLDCYRVCVDQGKWTEMQRRNIP